MEYYSKADVKKGKLWKEMVREDNFDPLREKSKVKMIQLVDSGETPQGMEEMNPGDLMEKIVDFRRGTQRRRVKGPRLYSSACETAITVKVTHEELLILKELCKKQGVHVGTFTRRVLMAALMRYV